MFDFQRLDVYQRSKKFYSEIKQIVSDRKIDSYVKNQLSRAAFSIPLNLAEGSGKFSKADRKNYYTTARASLYECVAVMDVLHDEGIIQEEFYQSKLKEAEELSRILYTMIQNLRG